MFGVKMMGCRLEKFPLWLSCSCFYLLSHSSLRHFSSLRWQTWALALRFHAQLGLLAVTCSVASHDKWMIHGLFSVYPWLALLSSLFMSVRLFQDKSIQSLWKSLKLAPETDFKMRRYPLLSAMNLIYVHPDVYKPRYTVSLLFRCMACVP